MSCENELKCNENEDETNSDKQENISCENELKCNENKDNTCLDDTNFDQHENISCENELKCNENEEIPSQDDDVYDNDSLSMKDADSASDDVLDRPLSQRRTIKPHHTAESANARPKKMEFKTYQCYVCFKLYETKEALVAHCSEHFDVCHSRALSKCPLCGHVGRGGLTVHMRRAHGRRDGDGDLHGDGTRIPSVSALNKAQSDRIDKSRRQAGDRAITRPKLVKQGTGWIVSNEALRVQASALPELTDRELSRLRVSDCDVDRLGQLSRAIKRRGLTMMFPCFECEKICQTFSALKLHQRRHQDNPVPFKPRDKTNKQSSKKVQLDKANRSALPRPITGKHKCDDKLKEFFQSNIRGEDVQFWQFLKIYNRMDREEVNDFADLEKRTDFGNHVDYYKDVKSDEECEENEVDI